MRALTWGLVWLLCLLVALWTLIGLPIYAAFGSGARAWKVAVSYDQLGNVAAGGHEDETFSSRCWRRRDQAHYRAMGAVIDLVFLKLRGEENHCENAYLAEQAIRRRAF